MQFKDLSNQIVKNDYSIKYLYCKNDFCYN